MGGTAPPSMRHRMHTCVGDTPPAAWRILVVLQGTKKVPSSSETRTPSSSSSNKKTTFLHNGFAGSAGAVVTAGRRSND
eukprot:3586286-Prymnesium_polylepis.1